MVMASDTSMEYLNKELMNVEIRFEICSVLIGFEIVVDVAFQVHSMELLICFWLETFKSASTVDKNYELS